MVGGVTYAKRVEQNPFWSTWREPSVLKNDVWMTRLSDDFGTKWTLVNQGCVDPQASVPRVLFLAWLPSGCGGGSVTSAHVAA